VQAYGDARDEDWAEWLQTHRIELNALSTEAFLRWLDGKLAAYDTGKVIPPADVLEERYTDTLRAALEEKITEEILASSITSSVTRENPRTVASEPGRLMIRLPPSSSRRRLVSA
jgi:hypothetical protein